MSLKYKRTTRLSYFHKYVPVKAQRRESSPHMGEETLNMVQNLDRDVNVLPA